MQMVHAAACPCYQPPPRMWDICKFPTSCMRGMVIALLLCAHLTRAAEPAPLVPPDAQPGDLIFREGTELVSHAVLMFDNAGFSHVGMLVAAEDGDGWQVLHATPSEVEGRPDAVVLDSLGFFTDPARSKRHRVYRVLANAAQRRVAVDAARQMLGRHFSMVGRDNGTYCTEVVYRAWQEAGIDLDVRFKRLRFLLFDAQDYITISALLDSPKLEPLPSLMPGVN